MINSQIGNEFHISSLIVQMDWCDRGCYGCYIGKGKNKANFDLLEELLTELIDITPEISCDELILSFASGAGIKQDKFGRFNTSLRATSKLAFFLDQWPKEKRLVLGFKDIVDCVAFISDRRIYLRDLLEKAEIAISDVNSLSLLNKVYRQFNLEPRIIYNWTTSRDRPLRVQQIYAILMKPALEERQVMDVRDFVKIYENLDITEDRCVTISLDKKPCSAGTQSFHIWPDGNVTGCPYRALDPEFKFPEPPKTLEELIGRIKKQQEHPDPLDYCPANPMNNYKAWNNAFQNP